MLGLAKLSSNLLESLNFHLYTYFGCHHNYHFKIRTQSFFVLIKNLSQAMKFRNDPSVFLHDPEQTIFDVPSVQFFVDNVMNPCQDSTWTFLTKVFSYLRKTHQKFGDFHKIIHIGGDEVPHRDWDGNDKSVFENSPACQKLIQQNLEIPGATWQALQPTKYR